MRNQPEIVDSAFYEEGSRLLTPGAFHFVLDTELRRAVRSRNSLTLVLLQASQYTEDANGSPEAADDHAVREVGTVVGREVRETDLIGRTDKGTLALVLLDSDFDNSTRVIDRVVSRIEGHAFPVPLRIAVGAACYPAHAVDAATLAAEARTRPVVGCRPLARV